MAKSSVTTWFPWPAVQASDYHCRMMIAAPTLITIGVALFTIANPIGTIPVFLALTKTQTAPAQRRTALMVGVGVAGVLLVSLVAGTYILNWFQIDLTSFKIAGFAYVATISWAMMTHPDAIMTVKKGSSVAIVPLAMPIVAGPGAIAIIISYAQDYSAVLDYAGGALICLITAAATAVIFWCAPVLSRLLGETGMGLVTRLFGLILLAICVQAIASALTVVFPDLKG